MNYSAGELEQTAGSISRKWGIHYQGDVEKNLFEAMRNQLIARIKEMLLDDFEGLVNAMYRVDIPEKDFRQALTGTDQQIIAENITALIIQREIKRTQTWNAYKNKQQGTDPDS